MNEPTMALPEGQTCAGCFHFDYCRWFISRKGPEIECDWFPSRFAWPAPPLQAKRRRDLARDAKLEADRGEGPRRQP
jgi:hypothetical protein